MEVKDTGRPSGRPLLYTPKRKFGRVEVGFITLKGITMNCQIEKKDHHYEIEGSDPLPLILHTAASILATLKASDARATVVEVLGDTLGHGKDMEDMFELGLISQVELVYSYVDSWVKGKLKCKPLPIQYKRLMALALSEMARLPRNVRTPALGWGHLNEQFIALNSDGTPSRHVAA